MPNFKLPELHDANGDIAKRWYISYYFPGLDGKLIRKRVFISTLLKNPIDRYKKADELMSSISKKLRSGWSPFENTRKKKSKLIDVIDYILEVKNPTLRNRTAQTYKCHVNIFKLFLKENKLDNILVDDFNYYRAQEFMDWLLIVRKLSNRTYNNYKLSMNTIFITMIKREYLDVNPFAKIEKLRTEQAPITAWTKSEMNIIKSKLPEFNKWLYLATQMIFYCFARPQELVRLKISDINFVKKELILHGQISKNKTSRSIAIPDPLSEIMNEYNLQNINPNFFLFANGIKPGKEKIAPTRLAEQFRKFADKENLPEWKKMYDLKHTGAGMCVDAGINVRDLQLHLRHHSLEQTQIYIEKFRNITSGNLRHNFPEF